MCVLGRRLAGAGGDGANALLKVCFLDGDAPACHSTSCLPRLQGTQDDVIDISHGRQVGLEAPYRPALEAAPLAAAASPLPAPWPLPLQLHQLCKRPSEPLWAEGRGHQDVEACPGGGEGGGGVEGLAWGMGRIIRQAPDSCASPPPTCAPCMHAEYVPRLRRFLVECWGEEYERHARRGASAG